MDDLTEGPFVARLKDELSFDNRVTGNVTSDEWCCFAAPLRVAIRKQRAR
jgi:hypothetical protein